MRRFWLPAPLLLLLPTWGCHVILPLGGDNNAPGRDAGAYDMVHDAVRGDLADATTTDAAMTDARIGDLSTPDLPPLPTTVNTIAGTGKIGSAGGPAHSAEFQEPHDVAVDSQGRIYVADFRNHCIRLITRGTGGDTVSTVAGTCGTPGALIFPTGVTLDASEGTLYIADFGAQRIRSMDTSTKLLSAVAGSGAMDYKDGTLDEAMFEEPGDVAVVESGGSTLLYVTEFSGHRIRQIDVANNDVSTLTGGGYGYLDGPFSTAQFQSPHMLIHDGKGVLYVTGFGSDCVRKLDLASKMVSTVGVCDFSGPSGLALDAPRGMLYVSEYGGNKVRRLDLSTGNIDDVAGSTTAGWNDGALALALFNAPEGLLLHQGKLYVADFYNHRIRVLE